MSVASWILAAQNAPKIYWGATAFAIGYAPTRRLGFQAASFGLRATGNVAWAGARALSGTTLLRGGSMTLGGAVARASGAVTAGYVLGAVVGTAVAYEFWGEEGAHSAMEFYTNPTGVDYFSTVGQAIRRTF